MKFSHILSLALVFGATTAFGWLGDITNQTDGDIQVTVDRGACGPETITVSAGQKVRYDTKGGCCTVMLTVTGLSGSIKDWTSRHQPFQFSPACWNWAVNVNKGTEGKFSVKTTTFQE